ncbi:hypothetical protein OS493_037383 [Desmophyllum pertusum]|uniref:Uncharacterized protein n=1 Tax=Desmophyllum pertusum TaxID=174260 RepID=A0A9W9ZV75_9CNID|nr:hypothetical protein OS493_037383 [Desmophyllum pertusum]
MAQSGWTAQCDSDSGPSGTTECIQIWRYNNQYQWATCLTNAYIQQKSSHKHACEDRYATYCWYQCMIEVYNKKLWLSDRRLFVSLPLECYSPSGDSCDWYRNCLEKKYPCEASSNAYAIRYAEKFCRLYDQRLSLFSLDGQKWVDGVRKCLQVALVPLLRPWLEPTCEDIRQKAFSSHTPCYLKPDINVLSICDLDCSDYFKIFWTIKGSFIQLDTAWESIKGMWNIETKCGFNSQIRKCFKEGLGIKGEVKFTKLQIKKFKQRQRRSTDPLPEADAQSRFADGVGSSIASALKWNTDVMDWLAYTDYLQVGNDNLNIIIVLADKKALGIVTTPVPSVDFNQTIQEFASAVKNGNLSLQVDGYNVWVKSLASCSDKSCDNTQTLAVSDKPPKWNGAAGISHGNVGLCGAIAVLIVLMDKLFY